MKILLKKVLFFLNNPSIFVRKVRYFVLHPLVFLKWRSNVNDLKSRLDVNFDPGVTSTLPIDVVFPTIAKDFSVVTHMIDSVREYVRHPIGNVYIISPDTEEIRRLCQEKNCIFVNENTMLPITKKDINYTVNGQDRSGWLFQQLLKWAADKLVSTEYFLITESDTVFIRPRVFEHGGKVLIPASNELPHIPYFEAYERLLGKSVLPVYAFTSHHALYHKTRLAELKQRIEEHCCTDWYKAIIERTDRKEGSSVSDYETYSQFVYSNYPQEYIPEYWANLSLSRREISKLEELSNKYRDKYKVLSFHSYNE